MPDDVPVSVFLSYSRRDEELRERLETHLALLRHEGRIAIWHPRRVRPGEPWAERISSHLETADLVLLLVSADFLASDYAREVEMRCALERHRARTARVVPIVLRPCNWKSAPFGELQALPRDGRPVASWEDPDEAWTQVARELRGLVDELRRRPEHPAEPEPPYPNDRIRDWSRQLRDAYRRQEELALAGDDVAAVEREIDGLRRRLREGGLQSGDLLARGRLQLIGVIGSGGFATVWKAWDRRRRSAVAVKVLHAQYARDTSRRQRFFRGAREMAGLRHPGIVRVIEEHGRDGRFHFFVMELVDDGDLRRGVLEGRIRDVGDRLRLVLEVGDALAYAHEQGIVHRDVKPANLLIDGAGRARLTDFDLVRAVDSSAGTRTGSMLGTWAYAAPELMIDAKEADSKADVYGLGMTAVFAVHGRDLPPHVLRDAPGFVAGLETSEAVRDVLAQAVAWEPAERFESVAAFCRALRASLIPARELPPPPPPAPAGPPGAPGSEGVVRSAPEDLFLWIDTPADGRVPLWREIPSGSFRMGNPAGGGHSYERPSHRVTVSSPFRTAAVPVTNAQFAAFDPRHEPRSWKGVAPEELAFHPVVDVSWEKARDFCLWLRSTFEWAAGARLPTEEEWEYACRAGSETRYWSGDGEADLARVGWYDRNSEGRTHRVGEKPCNPWGLYDVHGNVWEWTSSEWTEDYAGREEGTEIDSSAEIAEATSGGRVVRGGSYWVDADWSRSAYRDADWIVDQDQGFRVLLPAVPAAPS